MRANCMHRAAKSCRAAKQAQGGPRRLAIVPSALWARVALRAAIMKMEVAERRHAKYSPTEKAAARATGEIAERHRNEMPT